MSRSIYKGGLRIKEQHLIILDLLRLNKADEILAGTQSIFRTKMLAFMIMALGMKYVFDIKVPTLLEVIFITIFLYFVVTCLIGYAHRLNASMQRNPFILFVYLAVLMGAILVLSLSVYVTG